MNIPRGAPSMKSETGYHNSRKGCLLHRQIWCYRPSDIETSTLLRQRKSLLGALESHIKRVESHYFL